MFNQKLGIIFLISFIGCGDEINEGPAPLASFSDNGDESSSEDPGNIICDAFAGCLKQCVGESCRETCGEATDADVDTCLSLWCFELTVDCADGNKTACLNLQLCADPEVSSSSSESSSDSESSESSGDSDSSSSEESTNSDSTGSESDSGSESSSD